MVATPKHFLWFFNNGATGFSYQLNSAIHIFFIFHIICQCNS